MSSQGTTFPNLACWRNDKGEVLCSGTRTDTRGLVVSIPSMLVLDMTEVADPQVVWDFPEMLVPSTKLQVKRNGLVYDLVGFGLYFDKASHFITRYTLKNHSDIFVYDGMKNNRYSMRLDKKASFATHLAGNNQGFPGGYKVSAAIYHLRGGTRAQDIFFNARIIEYSN